MTCISPNLSRLVDIRQQVLCLIIVYLFRHDDTDTFSLERLIAETRFNASIFSVKMILCSAIQLTRLSLDLFVRRSTRTYSSLLAYAALGTSHAQRIIESTTSGIELYCIVTDGFEPSSPQLSRGTLTSKLCDVACILCVQTSKRLTHDASTMPSVTPKATRACFGSHP